MVTVNWLIEAIRKLVNRGWPDERALGYPEAEHHIWDIDKVKSVIANQDSRNLFLRWLEEFFKIYRFI